MNINDIVNPPSSPPSPVRPLPRPTPPLPQPVLPLSRPTLPLSRPTLPMFRPILPMPDNPSPAQSIPKPEPQYPDLRKLLKSQPEGQSSVQDRPNSQSDVQDKDLLEKRAQRESIDFDKEGFIKKGNHKFLVRDPQNTRGRGYIDPTTGSPYPDNQPYLKNLSDAMYHSS
jgi:hypothetical protein